MDEVAIHPSETKAHRSVSRICIVPKRDEFLIIEQNDILLIEVDEPITYNESLNSSESDKCLEAMKSKMDSM